MDEKPENLRRPTESAGPLPVTDESQTGETPVLSGSNAEQSNADRLNTERLNTERLFEKAVADNSRRLLGIARGIVGNRASPEDVVQQAVMNLYQHRQRYDWREPGGLLRRAVVNESLRILRQPRMTAMEEEYHGATSSPPEAGLIDQETILQVRQAIEKLPDNFKAALVLCEYEKMPYAQIASTLNASIPQVKTWIFRARRQLAEMLKGVAGPNA